MSTVVSCACGARFRAPDQLQGRRVACPTCGGPLDVPAATPDPFAADFSAPAAGGPQVVACGCGQRFRAPPHLAGQSVACPSCGQPIQVPPVQAVADGPLAGDPLQGQFAAPAASPGWSQPGAATPAQKAPSSPSRSTATWVLGLAAGVGAAVVMAVLVFVLITVFSAPDRPLAQQPLPAPAFPQPAAAPQPLADQPQPPRPQPPAPSLSPAQNGLAGQPANASPTASTNGPQTNGSLANGAPANGAPTRGTSMSGSPTTAGPQVPPTEEKPAAAKTSAAAGDHPLASSFLKWHGEGQQKLRGMRVVGGNPNVALVVNYSWMTELLPHLGYQAVYDKFDFRESWTTRGNLPAAATLIPEFLNPLDDRRQWKGYPYDGMPLTHFVGMSGLETRRNDVAARFPRSDPRAGVFGYDHIAQGDEIGDGTSHTIAIIGSGEIAAPWVQAGGATIRGAREPHFDRLTGFGSRGLPRHGAMTVFADGSVRTITGDIDPEVFRALSTINGGEKVDLSNLAP